MPRSSSAWAVGAPRSRAAVRCAEPRRLLPAIRALARKLDVDLNLVQGNGAGGMITRADVERAARSLTEAGPAEPLKVMWRAMAQRMALAHAQVVPTTVIDEADINNREIRYAANVRFRGPCG